MHFKHPATEPADFEAMTIRELWNRIQSGYEPDPMGVWDGNEDWVCKTIQVLRDQKDPSARIVTLYSGVCHKSYRPDHVVYVQKA